MTDRIDDQTVMLGKRAASAFLQFLARGDAPHLSRCCLCARPGAYVGVFVPNDPRMWCPFPLVPGKQRTIGYSLCKRCKKKPNKFVLIEEKILRWGQANAPVQ